jgi:hypothetical protein
MTAGRDVAALRRECVVARLADGKTECPVAGLSASARSRSGRVRGERWRRNP